MANHEGRLRPPAGPTFDLEEFLEAGGVSARVVRHRAGDVIYSQGDRCDSVFYVQKGEVKLAVLSPSGKEAIVAVFEPGDFFGEGALSGQPLRLASASATSAEHPPRRRAAADDSSCSTSSTRCRIGFSPTC